MPVSPSLYSTRRFHPSFVFLTRRQLMSTKARETQKKAKKAGRVGGPVLVRIRMQFFLPLALLRPHRSSVTGRQKRANKKRGPSCTGRVTRHLSELGAGHGVLTEGIMLGQDVVPKRKRGRREPMSGFQHAAGCKAAGESCSQWVQPNLEGMREPPARQHQHQ